MKKLFFSIGFFGLAVILPCFVFCSGASAAEDPSSSLQEISGTVQAVDWVSGKITLIDSGGAQVTVTIPEGIPMTRGDDTMMLSDVEQNDQVQIAYAVDEKTGALVARNMTDLNLSSE